MGFFDFGSKKNTLSQEVMMPQWQEQTGKALSDYLLKYLPQYQPGENYTGKLSADMTGFEQSGLGLLDKYLNSGNTGELFGAGKQQVMDTLGGKFADPNSSPYIKSMINLANMNLGDQINTARAKRGARGTYYTTDAIREEGDLAERTQNYLNTIVGDFVNRERQNMLGAANTAAQMDEYENVTAPLTKVQASQSLGSLQRLLEQADLERQYQDFTRKRGELTALPGQAQSLYSTSVPYGIKSMTKKAPSALMAMLGEAGGAFGSYNTHEYGYDVNQSSIKDVISMLTGGLSGGMGGMPTG